MTNSFAKSYPKAWQKFDSFGGELFRVWDLGENLFPNVDNVSEPYGDTFRSHIGLRL